MSEGIEFARHHASEVRRLMECRAAGFDVAAHPVEDLGSDDALAGLSQGEHDGEERVHGRRDPGCSFVKQNGARVDAGDGREFLLSQSLGSVPLPEATDVEGERRVRYRFVLVWR